VEKAANDKLVQLIENEVKINPDLLIRLSLLPFDSKVRKAAGLRYVRIMNAILLL